MFSVAPVVDNDVVEPSLYHLMVPSAAICVVLSSTHALYTSELLPKYAFHFDKVIVTSPMPSSAFICSGV